MFPRLNVKISKIYHKIKWPTSIDFILNTGKFAVFFEAEKTNDGFASFNHLRHDEAKPLYSDRRLTLRHHVKLFPCYTSLVSSPDLAA